MRRFLLALVVFAIAVFAIGGRSTTARRHADGRPFVAVVHLAHVQPFADGLSGDDGDDGEDDDEIGLACPPLELDDDDASPQVAAIPQDEPPTEFVTLTFPSGDDGLGPAHGHARAQERPPRG